MPSRIVVVGLGDAEVLSKPARRAIEDADLVVGGRRHLDAVGVEGVVIGGDIEAVLDAVATEPGIVCVLASGDPGFFGIVRPLAERFGALEVHPAPSSVSVAFARLGLPWDDAVVVSAHGRPITADRLGGRKVAVLTSPEIPPERVGQILGDDDRVAVVCSRLGLESESVVTIDVPALAAGAWDPLSVVVLLADHGIAPEKSVVWGAPDDAFDHRDGMITKSEVRAVVLSKLAPPPSGVLWDIGAGSGSVAIEAARLRPGLRVIAVERQPDDAARIRANAAAHGVSVEVVEGSAPDALIGLPDPDCAFVGGGGIDVLDAVRLRCRGRTVATFAALDRAAVAGERLGNLVQVNIAAGERLPDGGLRLVAVNPVFVTWNEP